MVEMDIDDDAGFDELHKPTFFTLCTIYSGVDSLLNHPFAVSTAVAELHKADASNGNVRSAPRIRGYGQFYTKFSTANNLSMNQALRDIMSHACPSNTGAVNTVRAVIDRTRCVYTGFPANFLGLLSGDLCQMVLYNYVKTKLDKAAKSAGPEHPVWTIVPIPAVSGFIAMSFCAIPCNAAIVVFRHQVCTLGELPSIFTSGATTSCRPGSFDVQCPDQGYTRYGRWTEPCFTERNPCFISAEYLLC
jgi:hypothetical protein